MSDERADGSRKVRLRGGPMNGFTVRFYPDKGRRHKDDRRRLTFTPVPSPCGGHYDIDGTYYEG